jgi:hypothetical protein
MPTTTSRQTNPGPQSLQQRLVAVRRRLRFVATCRGSGWLVAVVLLPLAVGGLVDWALHLPGLARAVLLVGTLVGAGLVAVRYLVQPISARSDDLTLALRVEEHFPGFNDSLASTVQFLEETGSSATESASLRRVAIQRTLGRAQGLDFTRVVDSRGLRGAIVSAAAAIAAVTALTIFFPALAFTAFVRLAAPFGSCDWPHKTQIEVEAPRSRIGRNEALEIRARLRGVIPDQASVTILYDGQPPVTLSGEVARDGPDAGRLQVRLAPDRVQRNFRFRVAANDAVSDEYAVSVLPPPVLVPLGPDEPSPRVHLHYPPYTDLPSPEALPAGSGNVDAVLGTGVSFRARADRSLRAAAIEFLPEDRSTIAALFLAALAANNAYSAVSAFATGETVWSPVPAIFEADRCTFTVAFLPRAAGLYALHFEDESGLGATRLFELRLRPDPAPTVQLERPSPARDLLSVLPDATLTLHASADDPTFAVRSVLLEYRVGREAATRRSSLHEPALVADRVAAAAGPGIRAARLKPRLQRVDVRRPLPIALFEHDDGSPPAEGDVISLAVCADDFDDVTPDKQPGRSHEVEIRVVARETLDVAINQEQTRIQQDLLRLREKEREALAKVTSVENDLKKGLPFGPDQLDQVLQAEQAQQQVREQVSAEQDGLRARAERVLEALRQNHLENSPERNRVDNVARELDRLSARELEQAEAQLANARTRAEGRDETRRPDRDASKGAANESRPRDAAVPNNTPEKLVDPAQPEPPANDGGAAKDPTRPEQRPAAERPSADDKQPSPQLLREKEKPDATEPSAGSGPREALAEARQHQEEIERTLSELLQRMEPWTNSREIKGEAGRLLQEQQKVEAAVQELLEKKVLPQGLLRDRLTDAQRAELDALSGAQKKLEERTSQLLDKMGRVAEDRKERDPATAQELQDARARALKENIAGQMREAAEQVHQNQLSKARQNQKGSNAGLKQLLKDLEERREAELERLAKKSRETEQELDQLFQEQERLKKKVKEAEAIADPKQREEALESLHRRQKELAAKARDLLQRLSRDEGAGRAGRSLAKAGEKMEQAAERLSRGEKADEAMDDALDRLDEARAEAEQATDRVEDELGREQRARVADVLRRLKERQEALTLDAGRAQTRLRKSIEQKDSTRAARMTLAGYAENQQHLGDEVAEVAKKELTGVPVFAGLVKRSATAMADASKRLGEVRSSTQPDKLPDAEAARLQELATRRLDQVMNALKDDTARGRMAPAPAGSGSGGGSGGGGGEDSLPQGAQLKVLQKMQEDVNRRSEAFAKEHPDANKIDDAAKAQLQSIAADQKDVAELLEQLRSGAEPDAPGGDNP